jgi:hypothetical protein
MKRKLRLDLVMAGEETLILALLMVERETSKRRAGPLQGGHAQWKARSEGGNKEANHLGTESLCSSEAHNGRWH